MWVSRESLNYQNLRYFVLPPGPESPETYSFMGLFEQFYTSRNMGQAVYNLKKKPIFLLRSNIPFFGLNKSF